MKSEVSRESLRHLSDVCAALKRGLVDQSVDVSEHRQLSFWKGFLHRRAQKKSFKKLQPQLHLIVVGAQDALRHPVALVGYLDGFEARSIFDKQLQNRMPEVPQDPLKVQSIKLFIVGVFDLLEAVFSDLASRENLSLSTNGPTKPGPERTIEVAQMHLESLFLKVEAACLSNIP